MKLFLALVILSGLLSSRAHAGLCGSKLLEELKVEEPKMEEPKMEEPKMEEPKIDQICRAEALEFFGEIFPRVPTSVIEQIESYLHLNLNPDNEEITAFYEKAMDGDSEAQLQLSYKYFFVTDDAALNPKESFFWLSKSANKSNKAKAYLGYFYLLGYGVIPDTTRAFELFTLALTDKKGCIFAESNLGLMYLAGNWVSSDYATALSYLQNASRHNSQSGIRHLALMYEKGILVEKNLPKALSSYIGVADFTLRPIASIAHLDLGILCAKGRGVEQDDLKAIEYFKKAIKLDPSLNQENYKHRLRVLGRKEESADPRIVSLLEEAFQS